MKRIKSLTALMVLAILACALVVGCGGSSSSDTSTAAPLSKSEFISEADSICENGNSELADAAQSAGLSQASSEDDFNAFINDTVLPNIQKQADAIDALGAPEGDEDEVQAIVDSLNTAITETQQDPNSNAFTESNKLAQAYGLKKCGQS